MRATLISLLILCALGGPARTQTPLDVGPPEAAFAGGPIRLSKNAATQLREHYQGDKVPLVPQPFRGRLDTAFLGRDWPKVEEVKKDLAARQGIVAALAWEQSRFVATGSIGIAEMHALDLAATGNTGLSETAVMLWFYAVAVTLTDGHKCADEQAKDAHLDRLRGPAFEPVTRLVRSISDDRLAAMRDLAIRLETVLAPDRTDDTMCREGTQKPDLRPDPVWRPEAGLTRGMLPRHLAALTSVMRPRPIARPEPPKPDVAKADVPKTGTAKASVAKADLANPADGARVDPAVPPLFYPPVLALPVPLEPEAPAAAAAPDTPAAPPSATPEPISADAGAARAASPAAGAAPGETQTVAPADGIGAIAAAPGGSVVVNQHARKPDPGRFEPPRMELVPADPGSK